MSYVLEIENGLVKTHPISVENLLMAYPNLDANNLPEKYKEVILTEPTSYIGPYEKYGEQQYAVNADGVYTVVWNVVEMTAEEKIEKINYIKSTNHPESWVWSEVDCSWIPPIEMPKDGKRYIWDETGRSWVESDIVIAAV